MRKRNTHNIFLLAINCLMLLSFLPTQAGELSSFSKSVLVDTNQQNHELGATHFQKSFFVEENTTQNVLAKNFPTSPGVENYKAQQLPHIKKKDSSKLTALFLPDKRILIYIHLFPFHFFR